MTALSPMQRVFAAPELAEHVFLELPARFILVTVQRVSQQWKSVVEWSLPIQRVLFFKPINNTPLVLVDCHTHQFCPWFHLSDCSRQNLFVHPVAAKYISTVVPILNERQEVFERQEASWRRQLCSQPAVAELQLEEAGGDSQTILPADEDLGGVGVWQLEEFSRQHPTRSKVANFSARWKSCDWDGASAGEVLWSLKQISESG